MVHNATERAVVAAAILAHHYVRSSGRGTACRVEFMVGALEVAFAGDGAQGEVRERRGRCEGTVRWNAVEGGTARSRKVVRWQIDRDGAAVSLCPLPLEVENERGGPLVEGRGRRRCGKDSRNRLDWEKEEGGRVVGESRSRGGGCASRELLCAALCG